MTDHLTTTFQTVHAETQDIIREEMTFFPEAVAFQDDIIDVALSALPECDVFDGMNDDSSDDARDYLDEVRSTWDLMGCSLREDIESLFTGIIYTADASRFYDDYSAECDDAVNEMGGFAETMHSADSVSDVVSIAADLGAMRMLSEKASDICDALGNLLDRLDDDLD